MENIKEIEIITTVEITHIYKGDELKGLIGEGAVPKSPEELVSFKKAFAEAIKNEIEEWVDTDYVNITNVQYFEKEEAPKTEESDG